MTVINPNSISGITSITLPSGGDNVLTIHTNDGTERFRIDSSGNVKVGSAATISPDGDVFFTGVTTATTFTGAHSGSGANLTSLPAAQLSGTLPAISAANLTNVPAANITGTLPALTAANLTNIPAANIVGVCTSGLTKTGGFGKILQVQSVVKTDQFTSQSTSFVDITGLSVNITPSATSSKILVMAQCHVTGEDAGTGIMLDRDGTEPLKANSNGSRQRFTIIGTYAEGGGEVRYGNGANHISFLDSPNTTSEVTYKLKAKTRSSNTFFVNSTSYTTDNTNASLGTSTLTVMEVAA